MSLRAIASLIGFDPEAVRRLPDKAQRLLGLQALLAFVSSLLFGLSAAYLTYIETYGSAWAWLTGLVIGAAVFLFALNIQRLFVTTGGFGMSRKLEDISGWRPDQLRIFMAFLLAVLFSQPLLLMVFHDDLTQQVKALADDQIASFRKSELDQIERRQGELIVRQQRNLDRLKLAGIDVSAFPVPALALAADAPRADAAADGRRADTAAAPGPAKANARRKALVIGVQAYRHAPRLNNPVKDAKDVAAALKRMGYRVTLVRDPDTRSVDLQRAFDGYIRSLQPGDISVLYFSGHGFQLGGTNYLAPADMVPDNPRAAPPLGLHSLIEEIGSRSPRASVFFIDACSSWSDAYRGGMRGVNADVDNYLAMLAATPGQTAIDLPAGRNSLYTQVLLKYLEQPLTLGDVVALTGGEVRRRAESMKHRQLPIAYGLINEAGFSLVDRSAAPRTPGSVASPARAPTSPADAEPAQPAGPVIQRSQDDPCLSEGRLNTACLLADHELTSARLAMLARERAERLRKGGELQHDFLLQSGHLEDRFRLQWDSPWTSAALSIVLTLLLWMGDVARDGSPHALREYERERYLMARQTVRENYERYGQAIHKALSAYPPDPRERLPVWDYDKDFVFEGEVRRPDHRELRRELQPDSVLDLLHDLGHPAGRQA